MGQMSRVCKNNTTVSRNAGGRTTVTLHGTCVVAFDENAITLNSGGWQTVTTKSRMNQASREYGLGYYVSQNKGVWSVSYRGTTVPFADGMTLNRRVN